MRDPTCTNDTASGVVVESQFQGLTRSPGTSCSRGTWLIYIPVRRSTIHKFLLPRNIIIPLSYADRLAIALPSLTVSALCPFSTDQLLICAGIWDSSLSHPLTCCEPLPVARNGAPEKSVMTCLVTTSLHHCWFCSTPLQWVRKERVARGSPRILDNAPKVPETTPLVRAAAEREPALLALWGRVFLNSL